MTLRALGLGRMIAAMAAAVLCILSAHAATAQHTDASFSAAALLPGPTSPIPHSPHQFFVSPAPFDGSGGPVAVFGSALSTFARAMEPSSGDGPQGPQGPPRGPGGNPNEQRATTQAAAQPAYGQQQQQQQFVTPVGYPNQPAYPTAQIPYAQPYQPGVSSPYSMYQAPAAQASYGASPQSYGGSGFPGPSGPGGAPQGGAGGGPGRPGAGGFPGGGPGAPSSSSASSSSEQPVVTAADLVASGPEPASCGAPDFECQMTKACYKCYSDVSRPYCMSCLLLKHCAQGDMPCQMQKACKVCEQIKGQGTYEPKLCSIVKC